MTRSPWPLPLPPNRAVLQFLAVLEPRAGDDPVNLHANVLTRSRLDPDATPLIRVEPVEPFDTVPQHGEHRFRGDDRTKLDQLMDGMPDQSPGGLRHLRRLDSLPMVEQRPLGQFLQPRDVEVRRLL